MLGVTNNIDLVNVFEHFMVEDFEILDEVMVTHSNDLD